METQGAILYGELLALYAEIEGMKVENHIREIEGDSPMYREDSFIYIANQIREHIKLYR